MYPETLTTTEIKLAINNFGHNNDYNQDAMIEFLRDVNSIDVVMDEIKQCPGSYAGIILDQLDEFIQAKGIYDECIVVTTYDDNCDTPQTTQDELDAYNAVYDVAVKLFETLFDYYDSKYNSGNG